MTLLRMILLVAGMAAGPAFAADPPLPFASGKGHIGAATCAGSNCHGATAGRPGAAVLQTEFFTWQRHDKHSGAYKLLLGERAKRIAGNLGLEAAHKAPACLGCHSNYVPEDLRGKRFRIEDGVSCEACHGGAQEWLGMHITGASHAENIEAGLYPTEDPALRARVCLQCHQGSDARPITHKLMGAGHPPLVFELDTYTAIQPPHYQIDADYKRRKQVSSGLKTWFVGQLQAASFQLDTLQSERFKMHGVQPELIAFDCFSCHHPLSAQRWEDGVAAGSLGSGRMRLNDGHLVMVGLALETLQPQRAAAWQGGVARLQDATLESVAAIKQAAASLAKQQTALLQAARQASYSKSQGLAILKAIAVHARGGDAADFTAAEQMALGIGALVEYLRAEGHSIPGGVDKAMDALLDATSNRVSYQADSFRQAVASIAGQL